MKTRRLRGSQRQTGCFSLGIYPFVALYFFAWARRTVCLDEVHLHIEGGGGTEPHPDLECSCGAADVRHTCTPARFRVCIAHHREINTAAQRAAAENTNVMHPRQRCLAGKVGIRGSQLIDAQRGEGGAFLARCSS